MDHCGGITDDAALDALLAQAADPNVSGDTLIAAQRVAAHAVRQRTSRRRSRRAGLLAVAALGLTGAGTLSAYQHSIPPYQGLEPGVERSQASVVKPTVNDLGRPVTCRVFIEFRHVSDDQRHRIDRAIASGDWSHLVMRSADDSSSVAERIAAEVHERVPDVAPAPPRRGTSLSAYFTGYAVSCL